MFTGVLSLSPPPRPVFPVYKLTNSLPTYRRALLSERLEQAKMQMTTLGLVSHYIFTFRKKSHASGTREGRDRYAKGAARTRGGEGFLQGGCDFLLSSAPRYFASLLATLLLWYFSLVYTKTVR